MIRRAGFGVIVNLIPNGFLEKPLKDEVSIVTKLGMKYIHIPINGDPTQQLFKTFVNTIPKESNEKIWVHCSVNMCASSFLFKYRCTIQRVDEQDAIWDLREIWEPFGAWKNFTFGEKLRQTKSA